MSHRAEFALALCIGLLVIAIRAPLMDLPLERDEGEYAYIAWRMTFGETPYLDWFDQKPPGIFAVYRLAIALAGDSVVAIRALAAVFSAISCIALFHLVRLLLGIGAGLTSALLLAFLAADPMIHGSIANTEVFMLPGIIIANLLVLRAIDSAKPPIVTSLAAGIAIGIAIAFKQVAALNVPFFLLAFGRLSIAFCRHVLLVDGMIPVAHVRCQVVLFCLACDCFGPFLALGSSHWCHHLSLFLQLFA